MWISCGMRNLLGSDQTFSAEISGKVALHQIVSIKEWIWENNWSEVSVFLIWWLFHVWSDRSFPAAKSSGMSTFLGPCTFDEKLHLNTFNVCYYLMHFHCLVRRLISCSLKAQIGCVTCKKCTTAFVNIHCFLNMILKWRETGSRVMVALYEGRPLFFLSQHHQTHVALVRLDVKHPAIDTQERAQQPITLLLTQGDIF